MAAFGLAVVALFGAAIASPPAMLPAAGVVAIARIVMDAGVAVPVAAVAAMVAAITTRFAPAIPIAVMARPVCRQVAGAFVVGAGAAVAFAFLGGRDGGGGQSRGCGESDGGE